MSASTLVTKRSKETSGLNDECAYEGPLMRDVDGGECGRGGERREAVGMNRHPRRARKLAGERMVGEWRRSPTSVSDWAAAEVRPVTVLLPGGAQKRPDDAGFGGLLSR